MTKTQRVQSFGVLFLIGCFCIPTLAQEQQLAKQDAAQTGAGSIVLLPEKFTDQDERPN